MPFRGETGIAWRLDERYRGVLLSVARLRTLRLAHCYRCGTFDGRPNAGPGVIDFEMSYHRKPSGLGTTIYNSQIEAAIPTYCPSCPTSLVLALVNEESGGNQYANSGAVLTSSAGAEGLFQLEPATASSLGVDPTTPAGNIQGGLTYLQQLYNQYGNWTEALEAYNEGPGALAANEAAGVTPVSAGYASSILSAAGISDSTGDSGVSLTSDLSLSSPLDALQSATDYLEGVSIAGLSGVTIAAGIVVLIGIALVIPRGK